MHPPRTAHRPRRPTAAWAWALALALLLAQLVGTAHRAAHALPAHAVAVASDAHGADGFAHSAGDATCQLLDHLLGGSDAAPATAADAVPAQAAARLPAPRLAAAPCGTTSPFQARGPPARA